MKRSFAATAAILALSLQYAVLVAGIHHHHHHSRSDSGGAAVAGALGGLAIGTMLGSAAANNNRDDAAGQRAEEKAEQVRIDHERQRVAQLEREMDRHEVERRLAESRGNAGHDMAYMIMIAVVIVLLFMVGGLSIMIMRRKP